jgi:AMMECR1 domain-containing protein
MGTVDPVTDNLAAEIICNAIAAGNEDDRFFPVEADELESLVYSVDVLSPEEPCTPEQLDHERYGVLVMKDERNALLLPNLPNIRSNEEQVQVALEKAGIAPDEDGIAYYRFEVTRYT